MKKGFIRTVLNGAKNKSDRFTMNHRAGISTGLFLGGVALIAAGTVLNCRATKNIDDIVENAENDISKAETKEDHIKARGKCAWELFKNFAPGVGCEVAGVLLIGKDRSMIKKENGKLIATVSSLYSFIANYRAGVVDRHGEEEDFILATNAKKRVVEHKSVNEDGKEIVHVAQQNVLDEKDSTNIFCRWFNARTSREFDKRNKYYNEEYLIKRQRYWNDELKQRWARNPMEGFVTVAEVARDLDLEIHDEDFVMGWRYSGGDGDHFIDFGLNTPYNLEQFESNPGCEAPGYLLVFNSGVIYGCVSDEQQNMVRRMQALEEGNANG